MATPFPVKSFRIRGATITRAQARKAVRKALKDKTMANNSNRAPKANQRSLLQQASDNAREATVTLAQIQKDRDAAVEARNRAQAALNEADRYMKIQDARLDAQRACVASYLNDVHELAVGGLQSLAANGCGHIPG